MRKIYPSAGDELTELTDLADAYAYPAERWLRSGLALFVVTVGLGLAGTLLALNQKPATVLRNL